MPYGRLLRFGRFWLITVAELGLKILLLQTLIPIRQSAEEGHGDGLGFVGEGGENDSGFEWDAVDCLKGKRYNKMEGSETSWDWYQPAEASGEG